MDAARITTGVAAVKLGDAGEKLQTGAKPPEPQHRAPAEYSAQQADGLQRAQALVSELVGANTRVQINRREDAPGYKYKAVDVETGEIIAEWPFVPDPGNGETVEGVLVDRRV